MKIFDFSNGVRGKLLANVPLPTSGSGYNNIDSQFIDFPKSHKQAFGKDTCLTLISACSRTTYSNGSSTVHVDEYKPETYNVEAIVMCTGKWRAGEGPAVWEWDCIATESFIKKNDAKWAKWSVK